MKRITLTLVALFLAWPSLSWAADKNLINMPGPKPALAKAFKSLGAGKYEFTMDQSKKLPSGEAVTFDMLKASLEKRSYVTSITGDAKKFVVSYTKYDEAKFLDKISKVTIKGASSGVSLAMEGSVSSGSARARTAQRDPADGEVKGKIISLKGNQMKVMVQAKGKSGVPADFPMMRPVTINAGSYKGKAGHLIFFTPTGKNGNAWDGKDFKSK